MHSTAQRIIWIISALGSLHFGLVLAGVVQIGTFGVSGVLLAGVYALTGAVSLAQDLGLIAKPEEMEMEA